MPRPHDDIDTWVDGIVAHLTLEEKAGLCSGADFWRTKAVERLGVGQVRMSDGPHGLRRLADGDNGLVGRAATCFPTAAGLAASWDPALAEEVGAAIGREALNQGVGVVLGPGTNIKRPPSKKRKMRPMLNLYTAPWKRRLCPSSTTATAMAFPVGGSRSCAKASAPMPPCSVCGAWSKNTPTSCM